MLDDIKPLSYTEWIFRNNLSETNGYSGYSKYLVNWYEKQKLQKTSLKQDYIQFLKDINFVFGDEQRDRFLSQIDFDNKEDVINSLPYFVSKIKELIKSFNEKRESSKKAKLKYNLASSSKGIELLLYEYILRSFTSKDKIAPVPYKELTGLVPELKDVNSLFFIEIEELYDKGNYFDQSPKLSPSSYTDLASLSTTYPYKNNLTNEQLIGILGSAIKERAASSPISNFFLEFLNTSVLQEDVVSEYDYINAINTIALNEKYLGNDLYALTAIKFQNNLVSDYTVNLELEQGNNWFYWPSGDKIYSFDKIDNIYFSIDINNSDFVSSGATGASSYKLSDIILTDKKGYIEGAWLMGPREFTSEQEVSLTIEQNEIRQFIWPYVGFNLTKNTNQWRGYSLNDESNKYFYFLSNKEKNIILNFYYTSQLPELSSESIFLNQTSFHKQGCYSNKTALDSDVIIKQRNSQDKKSIYNNTNGDTEVAFLYKFEETDIPITSGINNIVWPLLKLTNQDQNLPITITKDFCDPIELKMVSIEDSFKGAVAGLNPDDSDLIYKLDKRDGIPIEAAWLKNISINDLDAGNDEINVYKTNATREYCEKYINGPNQNGLYSVVESGKRISFIWGDVDTPADDVFSYNTHQINCPYNEEERDYYNNQDFNNPKPLNEQLKFWNLCSCKSLLYSPIGHKGDKFTDYHQMTDLLYADPQGLGDDFDVSTWRDTRANDHKTSPQFSFFKLDEDSNNINAGVGFGSWYTSSGSNMILKTGRRYTYYRTHLKTIDNSGPKFVINYDYKDQRSNCLNLQPYDIVLCVDVSNSQKYNLNITEEIIRQIVFEKPSNVQLAIVAFNATQFRCSYLSFNPDVDEIMKIISNFNENDPLTYRTNIYDALKLAYNLLTIDISENNKEVIVDFKNLCFDVNATIINAQRVPVFNKPRIDALKRIIVVSDGQETMESSFSRKLGVTADGQIKGKTTNLTEVYVKTVLNKQKIEVQTIDLGAMSTQNNLMETIANEHLYFNLQKYLATNDTTEVDKIIKNLVFKISSCKDVRSRWCKLVRSNTGSWIPIVNSLGEYEDTDIVLEPGDNLVYVKKDNIEYTSPVNEYASFSMPTKNFCIRIPLKGWDYYTNTYIKSDITVYRGARPFWGKAYVNNDKQNDFEKEFIYMGGHTRWLDYLPYRQPDISDMVLENGNYIEYVRRIPERLKIKETLKFKELKTNYQWNKLEFTKQYSNLSNLFKNDDLEYVVEETFEPSDLILEEYYEFKPAKYNYFARNPFVFRQDLFLLYKCNPTYSSILSAKILTAKNPYAHLDNVNFPTIALLPYTNNFVTKKQVSNYLLPTKLGVPYFCSVGYDIQLDENKIFEFEENKTEQIFLDPTKYGPITRGLSNSDNLSPTKIKSIDNRWMMIPYGSGEMSGIITNTKNTQKFTPYQSEYEILGINPYGVSKPDDEFQFYDKNRKWTGKTKTNFRGEVTEKMYLDRRKRFLAGLGTITTWKMDLFGNNYALFKSKLDTSFLETNDVTVNINDIDYDREILSSNRDPEDRLLPNAYENILYNSSSKEYLDFIIEEE
jgi:hypothetical protein